MFKTTIQGLSGVLKKIESYDKKLAADVDDILSEGANNIARSAAARAPKGKSGALAASISADTSMKYRKAVTVGVSYGPFVEFGTGSRVFDTGFQFTPEMRAYAMEFYVSGKGRLPPSPFLFPAYTEEVIKIKERIKQLFFFS